MFSYFASFEHNIFLMNTHDSVCLMDSLYSGGYLLYSRV